MHVGGRVSIYVGLQVLSRLEPTIPTPAPVVFESSVHLETAIRLPLRMAIRTTF
jgi:hypothetical protein